MSFNTNSYYQDYLKVTLVSGVFSTARVAIADEGRYRLTLQCYAEGSGPVGSVDQRHQMVVKYTDGAAVVVELTDVSHYTFAIDVTRAYREMLLTMEFTLTEAMDVGISFNCTGVSAQSYQMHMRVERIE